MRDTLLQLCLFLCIGMIVFSLIFSVIAGVNVTGNGHIFSDQEMEEGIDIDQTNKSNAFSDITSEDLNTALFISIGTGGIIGLGFGGAISWLTKTTSGLAVGLFSGVFWGSYINVSSILNAGSFLTDAGVLMIIHIIMALLFVGAIIGMFSGSG